MAIDVGQPHGVLGRTGGISRGDVQDGEGLLLVAHGSRSARSDEEMRILAELVAAALPSVDVELGFLEMSMPPAGEALDRLAARGCKRVVVLPLVLLGAGHAKSDTPAVVAAGRERHPAIEVRFGSPLGVSSKLVEMLGNAVVAAGGARVPLLMLARGSSDPDANSDAYKAARLVAEWAQCPWVQVGFSGITGPSVGEAAGMVARLGAEKVVLAWWFLGHGKLLERGRDEAFAVFVEAGVQVVDAGYIGPEPGLVPLVTARYEQALGRGKESGVAGVNCDLCAYRSPWPGLDDRVGQPIGVGHSHLAATHRHAHDH